MVFCVLSISKKWESHASKNRFDVDSASRKYCFCIQLNKNRSLVAFCDFKLSNDLFLWKHTVLLFTLFYIVHNEIPESINAPVNRLFTMCVAVCASCIDRLFRYWMSSLSCKFVKATLRIISELIWRFLSLQARIFTSCNKNSFSVLLQLSFKFTK